VGSPSVEFQTHEAVVLAKGVGVPEATTQGTTNSFLGWQEGSPFPRDWPQGRSGRPSWEGGRLSS
jgi:hypothetical protein